ncbi:inovirus Gp2 family protein [Microvirgula curvata]
MPPSTTARRHSVNTNLHLHHADSFCGLPVIARHAPFIQEYLRRLHDTLQRALDEHPRTLAVRFDLRLPEEELFPLGAFTNQVMPRFIDSLKAKIAHDRERSRQSYGKVHHTSVRYVWARELGLTGKPHYHCVLFLNQDAYFSFGCIGSGQENTYSRIQSAWASALRLSHDDVTGLVHVPDNSTYRLRRDDAEGLEAFFHRASYLCKAATKGYGDGQHAFGCSRR